MTLAPFLLSRAMASTLRRLLPFDLIDAHYFYPDGVAAVMLAKRLKVPVIVTARGTDINLIAQYRLPRMMIQWAARNAAAVVAVSRALKEKLVALGVPAARVHVLRNGVDLEFFKPLERDAVRAALGVRRTTLLSVGNLLAFKGQGVVIQALSLLPECDLVIAGDGPDRAAFQGIATQCGVAERVRFTGSLNQEDLREWYTAADALVLASSREGWPNVLLEAMACGTPVIATNVGGVSEIITSAEAGIMVEERSATALAPAVRKLLSGTPDRAATRRYAEQFGWASTTRRQLQLFREVISTNRSPSALEAARAG